MAILDQGLQRGLIIQAVRRLCEQQGVGMMIAQKGDFERGAIAVVAYDHNSENPYGVSFAATQAQLWVQTRNSEGDLDWYCPLGDSPQSSLDVSDYLQRAAKRDQDLWILEFDAPIVQNPFQFWLKQAFGD